MSNMCKNVYLGKKEKYELKKNKMQYVKKKKLHEMGNKLFP